MPEILFIVFCAVLCGASSYVEIEEFANIRLDWFNKFLELPNGVPSHDTFARVLSILNIESLEGALMQWIYELSGKIKGQVSLDGKVIRGTSRQFQGSKTLQIVSVYASRVGLVLAQSKAQGRGHLETDAALQCLESLFLKGALVSVDAGMSNRRMIRKIRDKGAHYIVPIKKNQRWSLKEIEERFPKRATKNITEKEKSHGRIESRKCEVISAKKFSEGMHTQWKDIKTVIRISRTRKTRDRRYTIQHPKKDGKTTYSLNNNEGGWRVTKEQVYYISSRKLTAKQALEATRRHWEIENHLHWSLDVIFLEDSWRVREKTAATNLSAIRRMAYNTLKKNPEKGSQRVKMKRAAWNEQYLERLLFNLN